MTNTYPEFNKQSMGINSANELKPFLVNDDGSLKIAPVDPILKIPVFMDEEHSQVHEGETHLWTLLTASLASGSSVDVRIVVPAGIMPHLIFETITTAETEIYLYEGTTFSANGTLQTVYNRNRNSAIVPATTLYLAPTVTTLNSNIWVGLAGGGNKQGSETRAELEFILKANTSYLYRVTSRAAGNKVVTRLMWYEHI